MLTHVADPLHRPVMQSFEMPNYEAALQGLREAFDRGYAEGKRLLSKDRDVTRSDARLPFEIDVPITAILDGEWQAWVPHFEYAGKQAALSARREREAKLDDSLSSPDHPDSRREHRCRWRVTEPPE
jgi:hypothetical protein